MLLKFVFNKVRILYEYMLRVIDYVVDLLELPILVIIPFNSCCYSYLTIYFLHRVPSTTLSPSPYKKIAKLMLFNI